MSLYIGLRYKGSNHFYNSQSPTNITSIQDIDEKRESYARQVKDKLRNFCQLTTISNKWQEVDA